jgi:mono/diheme cytochrome c family protein
MLVIACSGCGQPKESDRHLRPAEVTDFYKLYAQNCSGCHGRDGKLGPAPPLNDAIFLAIVPDAVLKQTITEGRAGTPMVAFAKAQGGTLTPQQIDVLVKGIRDHWKWEPPVARNKLPPYEIAKSANPAGSGNPADGKKVFARACAGCHGVDGQGKEKGAGAINDPAFLNLVSDQMLRRIVITGRPDLKMPHFADPNRPQKIDDFKALTPEEITDLVTLLASWRGPK